MFGLQLKFCLYLQTLNIETQNAIFSLWKVSNVNSIKTTHAASHFCGKVRLIDYMEAL